VVLDAATARKRAGDEQYRATPEAAMFRAFSGAGGGALPGRAAMV
jgi:hypothetical protein